MQDQVINTTKRCANCNATQPAEAFERHSRSTDGLNRICRDCRKAERKMYAERWKANAAITTEQKCVKCQIVKVAGDFQPSGIKKSGLDSYCKECRAAQYKAAYEADPAPIKDRARRWYYENGGYPWAKLHANRCRQYGIEVRLSEADWTRIKAFHGDGCAKCGSTEDIETDHIIAVTWGGQDDPWNIQPLCQPCNGSKSRHTLADYRTVECRHAYPCTALDMSSFEVPVYRRRKSPAPGLKRNRGRKNHTAQDCVQAAAESAPLPQLQFAV